MLDAAPKLDPDPVAEPVINDGVEKSGELPMAGVEATDGVLAPIIEGVCADPKGDVEAVPKGIDWGEKPVEPNRVDAGAEAVGVKKREVEAEAAEDGVLNIEDPLPDEASELPTDCCGTLDTGIPELANKPAP